MNTGLSWTALARRASTGSVCTRWLLRRLQRPSGTTATRRHIGTGRRRSRNLMRILYVYVTRRTDSRTGVVTTITTTLARNLLVTFAIITCGNQCTLFQSVYLLYVQERVICAYQEDRL